LYFDNPYSSFYLFSANDSVTICKYDSIPLGFFAIGGFPPLHYLWSPSSAVSNDTIESPYLIADTSTTLTISVSDSIGNMGVTTVVATVNPIPYISSIQSFPACIGCSNGMFVFTISGGTGMSIYGIIPFVIGAVYDDDTISGLPAGIYTICPRDENFCRSCITDTIFESNVIINEAFKDPIRIFPNPFTSSVEIQVPRNSGEVVLEWFDPLGKCLRVDQLFSGNNVLQKDNLPGGSYFGILTSNGNIIGRFKIMIVE
jgi:hypothetical protein